ncbi:hypothetical protein OUZ56_009515 [Daphnia magna]|uniref:Uncharacterized protein n=1 Tax=Daphnia magna TaxID=35525 RepID=A0ABR0AG79_9CRUS|nr:hypothetical protein OUZ56_009515 [Daphnia magna]
MVDLTPELSPDSEFQQKCHQRIQKGIKDLCWLCRMFQTLAHQVQSALNSRIVVKKELKCNQQMKHAVLQGVVYSVRKHFLNFQQYSLSRKRNREAQSFPFILRSTFE